MHRTLAGRALVSLLIVAGVAHASGDDRVLDRVGTWSELVAPSVTLGSAIYDPAGDRMILFGGFHDNVYSDETFAYDFATNSGWHRLATAAGPPAPRRGHTAVLDSQRHRMLVYGGELANGTESSQVWALSLDGTPAWTLLPAGGGPANFGHGAIYDPVQDAMFVYGGYNSSGGVYRLTLSGSPVWTHLATVHAPQSTYSFGASYDPAGRRMLVYGGALGHLVTSWSNDLWALSLDGTPDWTRIDATGTRPCTCGAPSVYDPASNRIDVLDGGQLFTLSLAGAPAWSAQSAPAAAGGLAILDSSRQRAVFYNYYRETWSHSFATEQWILVDPAQSPGSPVPRSRPSAVYDSRRQRQLLFGGYDVDHTHTWLDDVWELSLGVHPAWHQLVPTGALPARRNGALAVYDSLRDRMVVFGGTDATQTFRDVNALELSPVLRWVTLSPSGGAPPAFSGECVAFDAMRNRMIVIGDRVWAMTLDGAGIWSEITPAGTSPLPRAWASAVYDRHNDRLVLYGGDRPGATAADDVWALPLSGGGWQQLAPSGPLPPTRYDHAAIYDPLRGRMVIFGSLAEAQSRDDASPWALALDGSPAWTRLAAAGGCPGRYREQATYDATGDRMIVTGGEQDIGALNSAWSLQWDVVARSPVAVCPGAAGWYPGMSRPVTFGITSRSDVSETFGYTYFNARHWAGEVLAGSVTVPAGGTVSIPLSVAAPDTAQPGAVELRFFTWRLADPSHRDSCTTLAFPALVGVEGAAPKGARLAIGRIRVVAGAMGVELAMELLSRDPATAELFDVSGRRWARQRVAPSAPGAADATIDAPHPLPVGLYLVRLTQGRATVTARFVVAR